MIGAEQVFLVYLRADRHDATMMINIGFVHIHFPVGGRERATTTLAEYLVNTGRYRVFLFTENLYEDSLTNTPHTRFTLVRLRGKTRAQKYAHCLSFCRQHAVDLLLYTDTALRRYVSAGQNKSNAAPVLVFAHHGMPFWEIQQARHKYQNLTNNAVLAKWMPRAILDAYLSVRIWVKKKKCLRSYRRTYAHCHAFVVLCAPYRQDWARRLRVDAREGKFVIIPNALPPAPIAYRLVKKKQLLYCGRLTYRDKRVDRLVQIWGRIHLDYPDWELRIVGTGPEHESLQKQSQTARIERIVFLGYTKNPPIYYDHASILCMTSETEGYPLALMEAQQAGVVPIAFACCAGIRDILAADSGVLVTPFDLNEYEHKLRQLIEDENLRERLQQNAIQKAQTYNLEVFGQRYDTLFTQLVNPA